MSTTDSVIQIISEVLHISARVSAMDTSTPLLGSIPEFDSMAVVSVITALEDSFDIEFDDDDIDAETFETIGTLTRFVDSRLTQ